MNNNKKNRELLSRRDFFRKAAINTLPFIAAIAVPPIFTACSPEPTPTPSGCDGCSSACKDSCKENSTNSGNNSSQENTGNNDKYTAIDLGLSVLWATFDIGSTRPDTYPQEYYWGDGTGKATKEEIKVLINNRLPFKEGKEYNIAGTEYDLAHQSIGNGWRLPTETELTELVALCTSTHEVKNGIIGLKIQGPNGKSIFMSSDNFKWVYRFCSCCKCEKSSDGKEKKLVSAISFNNGNGLGLSIHQHYLSDENYFLHMPIRPVKNGGSGCKECSSGCTTTCTTTCSTNCIGKCRETCKEECKKGCGDKCSENCSSGCITGCKEGCKEGCKGGCYTGCKNGSKNSTGSGSSGDNSNNCGYCSNVCSDGCTSDCGQGCTQLCVETCTQACGGNCYVGCGTACSIGCTQSCGTTCHKSAF